MVLLIHPPFAKPSEPPAGIARLSGLLSERGVQHLLFDANLEGLIHLFSLPRQPARTDDAWTRRAFRNRERNLDAMRNPALYGSPARYSRAVKDLTRVLSVWMPEAATAGLANYEHRHLSPLRSADLLRAAEEPEQNPFYAFYSARFREIYREQEPAVAGISLNYLSQALSAFAMAGFLRREFPKTRIVFGGGLVTTWMRNPSWKNPFAGLVDTFVAGPGEDPLMSLLGLGPSRGLRPRPDYRTLSALQYLSPGFVLPYAASSGCSWRRCSFCPEKAEANPYLPVPPAQVRADIHGLSEACRPALIHLLDNAISPSVLEEFALRPPGAPWYGFARIGSELTDPEYCIALRKSGCMMLKLGIESGDQGVLDKLGKGIRIDTASAVLRNLQQAGIASYVYLLFGTPAETEAAARKTLDFTVRHADSIGFLNLAVFNMPRCGENWPALAKKEFSEGDLSLYDDFDHPAEWDRKRVRVFLERVFKRHPAVASILRNDPPVFTSNHAPFFLPGFAQERHTRLYK